MNEHERKEQDNSSIKFTGLYFLLCVIVLYFILYMFNSEKTIDSLISGGKLFYSILPVLVFVIFVMTLVFWLITPKSIKKYMGKGSGIKGWVIAVATGILTHGPLYVWYPIMGDLRDQGMKNSLISVFLSNKSIKLPFLPLMIFYFGGLFVAILILYMLLASLVQGWIFEMLEQSGFDMENVKD